MYHEDTKSINLKNIYQLQCQEGILRNCSYVKYSWHFFIVLKRRYVSENYFFVNVSPYPFGLY